jgi:4-amino-4-deoxychorismate lyase
MPAEGPIRDRNAAGFELIETMRWEPGAGFIRLDRHLARLRASARALGFAHDPRAIGQALASVGDNGPLRTRLTLAADGHVTVTTQPFSLLPPDTVWKVRIAETRLDANDPLLRHKMTRREIYTRARAEFSPAEADEVLLLNQDDEVCEGTITNVFANMGDGVLLTPPIESGLLPGVLRGEMINESRAKEERLTIETLRSARALFVGNSLRGLIRLELGV